MRFPSRRFVCSPDLDSQEPVLTHDAYIETHCATTGADDLQAPLHEISHNPCISDCHLCGCRQPRLRIPIAVLCAPIPSPTSTAAEFCVSPCSCQWDLRATPTRPRVARPRVCPPTNETAGFFLHSATLCSTGNTRDISKTPVGVISRRQPLTTVA